MGVVLSYTSINLFKNDLRVNPYGNTTYYGEIKNVQKFVNYRETSTVEPWIPEGFITDLDPSYWKVDIQ